MFDQIQQKQAYLRENILECGYDPEEFAQFCERKVGNVDIQGWSFDYSRRIANEFIDKKKENKGIKSEGASFMKYQQQIEEQVDVDQIDINNNFRQQVRYQTKEEVNQNLNNHEQSSVWGPVSSAFVAQEEQVLERQQNVGQQNPQQTNEFDEFGDFSVSVNQKPAQLPSNPVISIPKPICKPPPQFKSLVPKNLVEKQISFKKQISEPFLNTFETIKFETPPKTQQIQETRSPQQIQLTQSLFIPQKKQLIEETQKVRTKPKVEVPRQIKQQFFDNINCIKAKVRTLLNDSQITVEITGHQTISRSFVLPSYVVYTISTKPLNVEVKRKYAYFLKLRQMLNKFYPGIRLPFLEKGAWLSETGVDHIKAQKMIIQGFMNDLLLNKQLRNCRILEQFLTVKDKEILKQKFAQYEKMDDLKSIEELCLLRGSVDVAYTDNHKHYFEKLNPLLDNIEQGVDKCKALADKLSTFYSALIKTYTELQQALVSMQNGVRTFNSQVNFCEFECLEKSIKGVNDHYRELNNNVRLEARFLDRQFKNFCSYERFNIGTIREVLDIRAKMTDSFNRYGCENPHRHEYYLNNKKLDHYKQGLSQPSKHSAVLKYQMGFYNQIAAEETMRFFTDFSKKINNKIILSAAQKYLSRSRDLSDFYKSQKKMCRAQQ